VDHDEIPETTAAEEGPLAEETDAAASRTDFRSSIEASLLITALVGVWLIISAFAIPYEKPAAAVIWGIVVLFLAVLRLLGAVRSMTLALVTAGTGVLIVITAFVLGDTAGPTANMALMGLAIVVLQLVGLGADAESRRSSHG
jgi:hypothetical protein